MQARQEGKERVLYQTEGGISEMVLVSLRVQRPAWGHPGDCRPCRVVPRGGVLVAMRSGFAHIVPGILFGSDFRARKPAGRAPALPFSWASLSLSLLDLVTALLACGGLWAPEGFPSPREHPLGPWQVSVP